MECNSKDSVLLGSNGKKAVVACMKVIISHSSLMKLRGIMGRLSHYSLVRISSLQFYRSTNLLGLEDSIATLKWRTG